MQVQSDSRTDVVGRVARVQRPLAADVHRVLVAQNAALPASPARDVHLAALARGAAAVVTGQQVGLFLGPLYTLYKAASAIALARQLSTETRTPVVPVFWLQTEDHDLPEIATCGVVGESLAVPVDAGNRISIAALALPPAVESCLERLAALAGDGPNARMHLDRLRRHYRAGAAWSTAFAGVLAELFAPEGLVVLDPREFAAQAAPIHARAVDESSRIAAALLAQAETLRAEGRPVPIHVRPDSPLSFFHPDGAGGPRARLASVDSDVFRLVDDDQRRFTRAELHAALRADPATFSTSALLRPILQDTLLPTVAYVGGPAEVAYFAQLGPLYRAFDMTMPAVLRRASFRVVDIRTRGALDRLGLRAADVECPELELLARLRTQRVSADAVQRRLLEPFLAELATIDSELSISISIDARTLQRTRASVEHAVGRLARKLDRAACYADAELVATVRKLRTTLFPDDAPQERVLGLCALAKHFGDRELVERVLAAIDPFDPTLKELG